MTEPTPTLALEESIPTVGSHEEPDFRYGWRYVCRISNGHEDWERVPLTEEDVLHPQMGDYVVQNHFHQSLCLYLATVLQSHMQHIPGGLVLNDVRVEWGVPGLKGHAPDLTVLAEVWDPPQDGSLDLKASGGRVLLVIEVTSPSTRHLDVASPHPEAQTRFRHYAWAGIPLYIVIDAARRSKGQAPPIFGYELTEDGYKPLPLNAEGRLWVSPVGMWLGPSGERVVWFDADGQRVWDYSEEQAARQAAEKAHRTAEDRARKEQAARQAAEKAHRTAEDRARKEQAARQAAEERARELERQVQELQDRMRGA